MRKRPVSIWTNDKGEVIAVGMKVNNQWHVSCDIRERDIDDKMTVCTSKSTGPQASRNSIADMVKDLTDEQLATHREVIAEVVFEEIGHITHTTLRHHSFRGLKYSV